MNVAHPPGPDRADPDLPAVYARWARERPAEPALTYVDDDGRPTHITWQALDGRARELEHHLADAGVRPGRRVAVEFASDPDLIPLLLAVWRREAVVVPVDPLWGRWLSDTIVSHAGADVLARPGGVAGPAWERLASVGDRPRLPPDTAMISYTSGTTSDPKGVVLRHRHLTHAYGSGAAALAGLIGRTPRTIGCSMRASGLGVVGVHFLWAAVMGARVVSFPELALENADRFWARQAEHGVELTYLVPALISLLNYTGRPAARATRPVVLSGGAPLPARVQDRFQAMFGTAVLNIYGLTEVAFAAFFGDLDGRGRGTTSVGRPATVRARVRGHGGRLVEGPGRGELELTGPSLTDGYYDNPEGTAAAIPDGWLRTGDIVETDGDGRYRIVGRAKDAVMKGSFTVYLSEVEAAACGLAGVVEAGAVRLDLPSGTEDIGLVARVDVASILDQSRIREFLVDRLGEQRAPRRIVVTHTPLPKVGHGKLDRRKLAALWRDSTVAASPCDAASRQAAPPSANSSMSDSAT